MILYRKSLKIYDYIVANRFVKHNFFFQLLFICKQSNYVQIVCVCPAFFLFLYSWSLSFCSHNCVSVCLHVNSSFSLFFFPYVYLSICLYFYLSICLTVCLCVYLYICLSFRMPSVCFYPSLCLFTCIYIQVSIFLHFHLSILLSDLFVYLSILLLHVYRSICLPVCLFIHLSFRSHV